MSNVCTIHLDVDTAKTKVGRTTHQTVLLHCVKTITDVLKRWVGTKVTSNSYSILFVSPSASIEIVDQLS